LFERTDQGMAFVFFHRFKYAVNRKLGKWYGQVP
jgi:hypothetical protein